MSEKQERNTDRTISSTGMAAVEPSAISSDYKVRGRKDASSGTGVLGHNTATSGTAYGVEGVTDSATDGAAGLRGVATAASGGIYGVLGLNDSPSGVGMVGAVADSAPLIGLEGHPTGVWGHTDKSGADTNVTAGYGVFGWSTATSGLTYGVVGRTKSSSGYGVFSVGDSKTDGNHEVTGNLSVGKVGVEATLSEDQTVSDITQEIVGFDSTVVDDTNDFDTSTGFYTIPYDGDYQIDVGIDWSTGDQFSDGDLTYVEVWENNSTVVLFESEYAGGSYPHLTASKVVKGLSKGNDLHVKIYQATGGSKSINSGSRAKTWFGVNKIA